MRYDLFVKDWLSRQTGPFTGQQLADALNANSVFKRWTPRRVISRFLEPLATEGMIVHRLFQKTYRSGPYMSRRYTHIHVWRVINNNAQVERRSQPHIVTPLLLVEQPSLISPTLDLRDPITFNEEG